MSSLLIVAFLSIGAVPDASESTYYIGPNGSDANSGLSPSHRLASFTVAVSKLTAGDTLIVLNGVYEQKGTSGGLLLENVHGTESAPIVIKAQNERQAWLKGDGLVSPVRAVESSWIVIEGLRASSRDNPDEAVSDGSAVSGTRSHNIIFRRLLAHNPNRYENASVIGCSQCHDVLVEESEVYNFHRHGISFHRGDRITIRRSFVHARTAETPEDSGFYEGHGCCRKAGDEGFSFYFTSNSILENSVSIHSEQLSVIGGVATVLGNPGGQNNRMLGNISYKDLRPGGFLQSRRFINHAADRYGGFTGPVKNILYKDYLIVGGQALDRGGGFSWSVAQDATLEGGTFVNMTKQAPLGARTVTRRGRRGQNSVFAGCEREEVGGCTYRLRNALFLNNAYVNDDESLLAVSPPGETYDFILAHSNAWNRSHPDKGFGIDENIADDEGQFRASTSLRPTKMGLDFGECIVFVPEGSNMSLAGADVDGDGTAEDIGANILYRYVDGELTDEPLWDPQFGAYPHGAVIPGSPNDPSKHEVTPATIHKLLNVNANGCTLPYSADDTGPKTYYIAPEGSDSNDGLSESAPMRTFETVVGKLAPGDDLVLMDGIYTPDVHGRLVLHGMSGTANAPLIIRAANERRAWLKGDGYAAPIDVRNSRWIVIEGLRSSSADRPDFANGTPVHVGGSEHITLKRLLAHNNNRWANAGGVSVNGSQHILIEESELYYFHRNGFSTFQSNDVTIRRSYANSHGYADLPNCGGGEGTPYCSHQITQDGGDRAFVGYYASNYTVENSINEGAASGFGFISGKDTPAGLPSGDRARFLGNISLNASAAGAVQSRNKSDSWQPVRDVRFENFLVVGFQRKGFITRAAKDLTMERVTILGGDAGQHYNGLTWDGTAVAVSSSRQGEQWPSCADIGGCTYRLRNVLIADNEGAAFSGVDTAGQPVDFVVSGSAVFGNASLGLRDSDLSDDEHLLRHSRSAKPTHVGLGTGDCVVYIPAESNMADAGDDLDGDGRADDIGAEILYRYEDGVLTDRPLWDATTGAFPHGAVIEGSPNDPALHAHVASTVHQRLNVQTNGCKLPFAHSHRPPHD